MSSVSNVLESCLSMAKEMLEKPLDKHDNWVYCDVVVNLPLSRAVVIGLRCLARHHRSAERRGRDFSVNSVPVLDTYEGNLTSPSKVR